MKKLNQITSQILRAPRVLIASIISLAVAVLFCALSIFNSSVMQGVFAGFAVIVATAQATLFVWQLKLMQKTILDDKQASELEFRAYPTVLLTDGTNLSRVTYEAASISAGFHNNPRLCTYVKGHFFIKNFGRTPAYQVTVKGDIFFADTARPDPDTDQLPFVGNASFFEYSGVLFADETRQISFQNFLEKYLANYNDILDDNIRPCIIGRIDFIDQFRRPRWIKFGYRLHPIADGELGNWTINSGDVDSSDNPINLHPNLREGPTAA